VINAVRSVGRRDLTSQASDQFTSNISDDATQTQTPAIKLRIKIGNETVVGTKRFLKINFLFV